MKPVDVVRKLRREAAFEPAALDRGKEVLMAAIRQEAEPKRRATIVPQLSYRDIRAALAFLERAFGLREIRTARLVDRDGEIDYAMVEFGHAVVGMGPEGHHGVISPMSGGIPSQYISVYVDDVDAHYERAVAAGARIAAGLSNYVWGEEGHRTYEALDPEGHRWRFHQRLRAMPRPDTH